MSTLVDISGNGRNAVTGGATGPTLGVPGIGDGLTAVSFPGSAAFINWYSDSLRGAFNAAEGSVMCWLKVANAGVWTDAAYREAISLYVNSSNYILIGRAPQDNMLFATYRAGAVSEAFGAIASTSLNWLHVALTWSKSNERARLYLNGALYLDSATLGTWSGSLAATTTCIGAYSTTPEETWSGSLAHALLLGREATADEILSAVSMARAMRRITIIGDSIEGWGSAPFGWVQKLRDNYNGGNNIVINRSIAGNSILAHMDSQVAAAANSNSDIIIFCLGTNDDTGVGIQAEVEENLAEIKASNPNAAIYYANVWPRWTDSGGGTPVDKSYVRTPVAAACAAQSVTCWDTLTTPWIDAADTEDGLHPNASGMAKIYAEVLSRI